VNFARIILGVELYPYQKKWIRDRSKQKIFDAGRQVGKTTVTAIETIWEAFCFRDQQILIFSPTWRQTTILFTMILEIARSNPIIRRHIVKDTNTMLFFDNGSKVFGLTAGRTGLPGRGFSPTKAKFDEGAFIPDQSFTAFIPFLVRHKAHIELLSTPFGKRGFFYNAFIHWKGWSRHKVKSEDCPDMSKEDIEAERLKMTENEFRQEFEGEFIEEVDVWLPRELILQCVKEGLAVKFTKRPDCEYVCGLDIARFGLDETVFTVVEKNPEGEGQVIYIEATQKKPITDTIGRLLQLHKKFNFTSCYVDESGLGGGAVDILKEKDIPVRPITFTLQNKDVMYKNLKMLMEQKKIWIPNNPRLLNQLATLQYEFSSNGLVKIHHEENGHDDYPDSLALACMCLKREEGGFTFLEDEENVTGLF